MRLLRRKSLALLVLISALSLNGLAYAQTVEHEWHHAHHQAATHSSVLCSWMCAAGQMLDGVQAVPQARFHLLAFDQAAVFPVPPSQPIKCATSRGPPVLSL